MVGIDPSYGGPSAGAGPASDEAALRGQPVFLSRPQLGDTSNDTSSTSIKPITKIRQNHAFLIAKTMFK